eukprot:Skav220657  [mRNA]  locus=scaffold2604:19584:19886:- [translate_table: standard]
MDSDYPSLVCKGEIPGKDPEKAKKKRTRRKGATSEPPASDNATPAKKGAATKDPEAKAKASRKSSAYHKKKRETLAEGLSPRSAKDAAKEASLGSIEMLS